MSAVLPSIDVRPPGVPSSACETAAHADAAGLAARRAPPGATLAMAVAVLAQGAALAWLGRGDAAAILAGVALAGVCAAAWTVRRRVRHADVLVATLAFGGLGMMAGEWIARAAGSAPVHRVGMAHGAIHGAPTAASWLVSTGVMLLTCAAACRWTCAPLCHGGWGRRMLAHSTLAAGMVGGMAAAAALVAPLLVGVLGAAAGMHATMVLGMGGGVAAALPAVAVLAGSVKHPTRRRFRPRVELKTGGRAHGRLKPAAEPSGSPPSRTARRPCHAEESWSRTNATSTR
ncbi:MAG TPA: hypothetical protein VF705_05980, partial [Longimicrobium sp.]